MKTGTITIESVTVWCPTDGCDGFASGTDGSSNLSCHNLPTADAVECLYCGQMFRLPRRARTLVAK
jgi:hypothetical protein